MKRQHALVFVVFLLAGAAGAIAQQVVEEIVAVVNNDVITLSQYKVRYEQEVRALQQAQLKGEELDKQMEMLKKGLLDQMVSETLLLQMAKEKQIDVREQLKVSLENIKKANNLETDEDLKLALARDGLDYDTWIKGYTENLMRQAVVFSEVDRQIVIDDAETMTYYKTHLNQFTEPTEFKLRAIVLPLDTADEAGLEARRKEISGKLASGTDFGALAGEYNQAPLKDTKGDLGTVKKPEADAALAQVADKLKPGEVSTWFKTRNGWYLLKLEERKESRLKPFAEAKKDAENLLYQEKRLKALTAFFDGLKAKNYIKIVRADPLGE